jgi:hypothetical protein
MIQLVTSFFNKELFDNFNKDISIKRNKEYNDTLINNLNCNFIKKIHLFIEDDYSLQILDKLINNNETYRFQYLIINGSYINIPNAEFIPDIMYDFQIDLINKKFIKKDEFKNVVLENHTIINIEDNPLIKKNKSLLRKLLGC